MSALTSLHTPPDVIVVDNSPPPSRHHHVSLHSHPPLSPQLSSPELSPSVLSPSSHEDVIVLDTSPERTPTPPPQNGPDPILLDDTPRKRRRPDNHSNSRTMTTQDTSSVIVVDDDDSEPNQHSEPTPIVEVEVESPSTDESSSDDQDSDMEPDVHSTSSIAPHVAHTPSPEPDDVIEVSAVGPRALPSSRLHLPPPALEPRLSASRSRAPVYQRTQRHGTNAMSMPQLFNRNADAPSPSPLRNAPIIRRRYGLPSSAARASALRAATSGHTPSSLVPTLEISRGLLQASSIEHDPMHHQTEMLDLHQLGHDSSPPMSPPPNSAHGLSEFLNLSQELGGRSGAAGPSNPTRGTSIMTSFQALRPISRVPSRSAERAGPSNHNLNHRSTSARPVGAGHGQGGLGSSNARSGLAPSRHVTFSDHVTSIGHSPGIGNGIFTIGASAPPGPTPSASMFGRFSNSARHSPYLNEHVSQHRNIGGSSGASAAMPSLGSRVSPRVGGTYRRRSFAAGSSAGSSGRRRSSNASRAYTHYFNMVGGNLENRVHLQIMHGMAMNDRLDYEQLIQLDEQETRDRNRADKDQIDALPVSTATAADKDVRCCICMCDVEPGEKLRVLPCSHKYHKSCIDEWLTYNGCCPVDKKRIAPQRSRRKSSSQRSVRQRAN